MYVKLIGDAVEYRTFVAEFIKDYTYYWWSARRSVVCSYKLRFFTRVGKEDGIAELDSSHERLKFFVLVQIELVDLMEELNHIMGSAGSTVPFTVAIFSHRKPALESRTSLQYNVVDHRCVFGTVAELAGILWRLEFFFIRSFFLLVFLPLTTWD